ncbi:MAG: CheR family methyltransferase [Acidobacteriota bacterium]
MNLNDLLKYINDFLGIYFPSERIHELEGLISHAAKDSNFQSAGEFVEFLFSVPQPERIGLLAKYLTIGETYFFRENATLEALKPELIKIVNKKGSLAIWSAGCCTGEEPYSIAIMLRELNVKSDFRLNIIATDINRDFLKRASQGIFSNWSFRGVPDSIKQKYFYPEGNNKFRINSEIREMVNFSFLNLAEGSYGFQHQTGQFDVIVCRNVTMYFSEELRNRVIDSFYDLLEQDGFLALGLAEISNYSTKRFAKINYENTVLFQKKKTHTKPVTQGIYRSEPIKDSHSREVEKPQIKSEFIRKQQSGTSKGRASEEKVQPEKKIPREAPLSGSIPSEEAKYLFESGEYEKAISILLSNLSIPPEAGHNRDKRTEAFEILIKALTSAGDISLAIDWCRKGIEENKLSARFYILLANLLNVSGDVNGAIEELKRAVYLEPGSFLANYYLANIFRKKNEQEHERRYLASALSILNGFDQDEVLQETEGISAGRMKEIVERQLRALNKK